MTAKEKILKFVNERKLEAIKDQIGNKMILIVKIFGERITSVQKPQDNFFLYEDSITESPGTPTIEGWTESDYGWYFDGLRFGINLNITCLGHEERIYEIKCNYNGYCVFEEIEGNIKSYAPFPEWRDKLEDFFVLATKRNITRKKQDKEVKIETSKNKLKSIVQNLKMLWNY